MNFANCRRAKVEEVRFGIGGPNCCQLILTRSRDSKKIYMEVERLNEFLEKLGLAKPEELTDFQVILGMKERKEITFIPRDSSIIIAAQLENGELSELNFSAENFLGYTRKTIRGIEQSPINRDIYRVLLEGGSYIKGEKIGDLLQYLGLSSAEELARRYEVISMLNRRGTRESEYVPKGAEIILAERTKEGNIKPINF